MKINKNGRLYIVATPIGNLGDISARALQTLQNVDFIAAEDTRVTGVLLTRFGIKTPMIPYHKFNEKGMTCGILSRMLDGQTCALVTDAGTPGISDPGAHITETAAAAGVDITVVPGPSAVAAALSLSGFAEDTYAFYGFIGKGASGRRALRDACTQGPPLAVFFESPHRILDTVKTLADLCPGAAIVLCNDLTKKFEAVYRGTPAAVLAALQANPNAHKGEYTLVVNSNRQNEVVTQEESQGLSQKISIEAQLVDICVSRGLTIRDAMAALRDESQGKLAKKDIYAASLRLKSML